MCRHISLCLLSFEFFVIGTQKHRGKLDCFFPTPMLSQIFTPAVSAWNLGVIFDNNFNLRQHISHIRDLRRICQYNIMSLAVANTIATALVSSRLDCCNFLNKNIDINDILKL